MQLAERTRAHSMETATPEASSLAPGALPWVSSNVVGVPGVVVAGDEDAAGGLGGICPLKDGVDVDEFCRLADAGVWSVSAGLGELVALHFKTVVAGGGDVLELEGDPVGGGVDAGVGGEIGLHAGERTAIVEGDKFFDGGVNLLRRDARQS